MENRAMTDYTQQLHAQSFRNHASFLPCLYFVLTCSPGFMHGALLLELLSQVIESLQTADLGQQPLFVALLHLLQALPGIGNILKEMKRFHHWNVLKKDLYLLLPPVRGIICLEVFFQNLNHKKACLEHFNIYIKSLKKYVLKPNKASIWILA